MYPHLIRERWADYLCSYIASRIYLHNPPGENNALTVPHDAPVEIHHEEKHLLEEEPLVNPWACMILLVITVGLMAGTAEFVSIPPRPDEESASQPRAASGEHRRSARKERYPN